VIDHPHIGLALRGDLFDPSAVKAVLAKFRHCHAKDIFFRPDRIARPLGAARSRFLDVHSVPLKLQRVAGDYDASEIDAKHA
jgi:hypothetical protein